MTINFHTLDGKEIAEVTDNFSVINKERDILDLMGDCGSARSILIHHKNMAPIFFDLSSGLAGIVLQKFATYTMKGALVINREEIKSKYFQELINEHSRSGFFRFFDDRQDTMKWLAS
jgi:hypothetical protein